MQKTCIKYAVHKEGTNVFGSLCSYREEAEDLLNDLKKNILHMDEAEKSRFKVAEITLSWEDK